ncbi:MAG: translation initiation factor IF-2 [Gloeomargaritaceae cyanobacterium C42_A2020_066]|nr:translation initiation factor IF-2 [Gloeomargaritaceae cyanobacterium C42_A2020_066]
MNNRVRLYDLSRELNLDNKDILALCKEHQISYKSHSSTITDAEAETLRQAAQRLRSSPSAPTEPRRPQSNPNLDPGRGGGNSEVGAGGSRPRPEGEGSTRRPAVAPAKPVKPNPRPQILDIRRHQAGGVPGEAGRSDGTVSPRLVVPPRRQGEAPPPAPTTADPSPEWEGTPRPAVSTNPSRPEPLNSPARRSSEAQAPPSLAPAPARSEAQPPRLLVRPRRVGDPPGAPSLDRQSGSSEGMIPEPELLIVTPPERLIRPVARPQDVATPGATDADHRARTLGKKRTREEEEALEERAKSAAAKQKRRGRGRTDVEDEEEDLTLSGADEADLAPQVTLALARPAQPRGVTTVRPTTTARPAARLKRGPVSRSEAPAAEAAPATRQRPEILTLSEGITVQELADQLVAPETEIIKILFMRGMAVTVNQTLDIPTATVVAEQLGVVIDTVAQTVPTAAKTGEMLDDADLEHLVRRPAVVTVMGHVDHGKTTLLDAIRKTKVAAGEAGGITQHIGAYQVEVPHEDHLQRITFLDTPGHEAFTAMRARGARVTDIAILVVAADDGVRPQTAEAIRHAQAAQVPIIVAINKIDKPDANPDRVKQELTEFNLVPEEWGGETVMVPVSALKGENLDSLLEMILLVSEVTDLWANPDRPAKGTVIEAHLDRSRGPVATLLVQNGTLRVGDLVVAGVSMGKVRAMIDDRGQRLKFAPPSAAVEIWGLADVPAAGDDFQVYSDEKVAKALVEERALQQKSRMQQTLASRRVSLGTLSEQVQTGQLKELNLILKADVQGSLEAILASLTQLPQKEVQVRVLMSAPGEVTETDVDLAAASGAVIVGFNTGLASGARRAADEAGVDIREYTIIYQLLEDIEAAMEGLLDPELVEEPLGTAVVRATFSTAKGIVAGCYIQSGKLVRNCQMRVLRGKQVVHEGHMDSLKRMREDAREVNAGYECGVGSDNFHDWQVEDVIEAFRMVTQRCKLSYVSK